MTAAKQGVKASASGRGAVQFTVPDNDHCIGNRCCCLNFLFAQRDIAASVRRASAAMQT